MVTLQYKRNKVQEPDHLTEVIFCRGTRISRILTWSMARIWFIFYSFSFYFVRDLELALW